MLSAGAGWPFGPSGEFESYAAGEGGLQARDLDVDALRPDLDREARDVPEMGFLLHEAIEGARTNTWIWTGPLPSPTS